MRRSLKEKVISDRCESSDSVRKPCAMVPPKGEDSARLRSTWIHWKSSTALAKVSMRSCVMSTQGETAISSPTRCSRSRTLVIARRLPGACDAPRAARDREVVVVMHAVDLVREGPVLAEHRVGMIARWREAGGTQPRADGRGAGEALVGLGIPPGHEKGEARESVRVRQLAQAHGVVVNRQKEIGARRVARTVVQDRVVAALADHAHFQSHLVQQAFQL